jgi:hypothetical protein
MMTGYDSNKHQVNQQLVRIQWNVNADPQKSPGAPREKPAAREAARPTISQTYNYKLRL